MATPEIQGPHQDQPIPTAGESLDRAQAAIIMIYERGATAESILMRQRKEVRNEM